MLSASLLSGTMAFVDFSQSATNIFRNTVYPDVTLHDDFDGENKDVYVENAGTSEMYVRVRLNEYMQIGNKNMLGQSLTDLGAVTSRTKDKWLPHTYQKADSGSTDLMGNCGQATGIDVHTYYKWNMSGRQIKYKPGTPGQVSSDLDGVKDGKPTVNDDSSSDTILTADTQAPILMSDFMANPQTDAVKTAVKNGCWILDDTATADNGGAWAYWSKSIDPNTATNLLLDEAKLISTPEDTWYYTIDVVLQAATLADTEQWGVGDNKMTAGAIKLVDSWS